MNEFLISAGSGFIIIIAGIALLSNFFFPLFLKYNDKMNEQFKDETPSEKGKTIFKKRHRRIYVR
jgi:hypothetical protein